MPENQEEMQKLMAELNTGDDPQDVAPVEVIDYGDRK